MAGSSAKKRLQENNGSPTNRPSTGGSGGSPTNRRSAGASGGVGSPRRQTDDGKSDTRPPYESPLKRVRRAVQRGASGRVFDTVDEIKEFVNTEDPLGRGVPASAVAGTVLHMRLVWTSFSTCATGPVARLHLVDRCVDNSVEEMHQVFKHGYSENKSIVDSELVTVSVYGVDEATPGLPDDGAIVLVSRMWSLKLFGKQSCQLTTSLDSIKVDKKGDRM